MKKADWVQAIDEAIEAKERIYAMNSPDRDRFNKNVEKAMIDIRPMTEEETLLCQADAHATQVRQTESERNRLQSEIDGLNAECREMMLAIQGAMPWMILLGDYIGNGTEGDPMGRCNAILAMHKALGRDDEETEDPERVESGRVDIR